MTPREQSRHQVLNSLMAEHMTLNQAAALMGLFEGPTLGNSAFDRLANARYQTIIEVDSYRERQSPHSALIGAVLEGGD